MKLLNSSRYCIVLFPLTVALCCAGMDASEKVVISTEKDIEADALAVVCENSERQKEVVRLFGKMGAASEDVTIEKFRDVENVVIRKPGATEEAIVIGAHYDKGFAGCGSIDNWTGVVAMAHAYKTLRPLTTRKRLIFAAFGKEEEGLVGSRAMVKAIDRSELHKYCAMINIDSLGLGMPQAVDQLSTAKLAKRTAEVAKLMNIPFHQGVFINGDSDSSSFRDRKIPALTIHGLAGDAFKIIHSTQDQAPRIKVSSVYLGYRLALSLIAEIDRCDCNAFR